MSIQLFFGCAVFDLNVIDEGRPEDVRIESVRIDPPYRVSQLVGRDYSLIAVTLIQSTGASKGRRVTNSGERLAFVFTIAA
jgi:hypothetical protein